MKSRHFGFRSATFSLSKMAPFPSFVLVREWPYLMVHYLIISTGDGGHRSNSEKHREQRFPPRPRYNSNVLYKRCTTRYKRPPFLDHAHYQKRKQQQEQK